MGAVSQPALHWQLQWPLERGHMGLSTRTQTGPACHWGPCLQYGSGLNEVDETPGSGVCEQLAYVLTRAHSGSLARSSLSTGCTTIDARDVSLGPHSETNYQQWILTWCLKTHVALKTKDNEDQTTVFLSFSFGCACSSWGCLHTVYQNDFIASHSWKGWPKQRTISCMNQYKV